VAGPCETLPRSEVGPNRRSAEGKARKESEEAPNKPATGLQLAYNFLATPATLRHCYGVPPAPVAGHDRVPSAERPRASAVRGGSVSQGGIGWILSAFICC
jgi:hypothetical protein